MRKNLLSILLAASLASAAGAQERTGLFGGHAVTYETRLDRVELDGQDGRPEAALVAPVFVSARRDSRRPVLFAFNGGPGSSSGFLRLGMLGPERLDFPADASDRATRLALVGNGDSPLDVADIVLVDPVGTGYSRLLDPARRDSYYSTGGDGAYVARFIRAWLERNGRTGSPVYILGESFGADRAVEVAKHLSEPSSGGVDLRGIVLLSESIGVIETVQRRNNLVGYAVGLPTMAAIAWYHRLQGGSAEPLEGLLRRVTEFAEREYLPALFAGRDLAPERRREVAARLAAFTGLTLDYILAHDLRVTKEMYRAELLRGRGQVVGRYDGRYVGPAGGPDPSLAWLTTAVAEGLRTVYADRTAPDGTKLAYRLTDDADHKWTYIDHLVTTDGGSYRPLDLPVDLMDVMMRRRGLRLMIAGGYFDTTASIGADEHLIRQNAFPDDRTTVVHYPAGHMFYIDNASRGRFAVALRTFLSPASGGARP